MKYSTDELGKYIEVLSGFAFKSKDFSESGIPIIKIKNINPPEVSLHDVSYVPVSFLETHSKYVLNRNDILIAMTGSHINQWASVVGRVARVKYKEKSFLNQRVGKIIVTDTEKCDENFVYYYLSQDTVKIELANIAGGAANQANISPTDIKGLRIPFPSIDMQRRIGEILSVYDDLIENNKKQIKLLEEMAQRLYKEWFVDLHFPGCEEVEIVDGVPEGWKKNNVGSLIEKPTRTKQVKAFNYKKEGRIPIIDQGTEFIAGYTDDVETMIPVSKPIIVFGDHTRILKLIQFPFAKGADGTQLIISNCDRMPQRLLYCSLMNIDLSNYHYARHFKYLKAEIIIVPTIEVAKKFEIILVDIFKQVQNCRFRIELAKEARNKLLLRLINGKLEV